MQEILSILKFFYYKTVMLIFIRSKLVSIWLCIVSCRHRSKSCIQISNYSREGEIRGRFCPILIIYRDLYMSIGMEENNFGHGWPPKVFWQGLHV